MRAFVVGAMAAFQFAAAAAEGEYGSTVAAAKGEECPADTGGRCDILSCLSFRHAKCVNGHCVCPEGSCAVHGRCVSTATTTSTPSTTTTTTTTPYLYGGCTLRYKDTERYLDAYESADGDYQAVMRPAQWDTSQTWIVTKAPGGDTYTIQQNSTMRYLDAYEKGERFAVTRVAEGNPSQVWVLTPNVLRGKYAFYIQQEDTKKWLAAYSGGDTRVHVTDFFHLDSVWFINPPPYWPDAAAMEMPEMPREHATDHAMQPGLLALVVITIGLGLLTLKVARWRCARETVAQPLLLG